jgi:hypothetical protein
LRLRKNMTVRSMETEISRNVNVTKLNISITVLRQLKGKSLQSIKLYSFYHALMTTFKDNFLELFNEPPMETKDYLNIISN